MPFDEARARALLAEDNFSEQLGIRLTEVEPDQLYLELDVDETHLNFYQLGHGGMVFSLADCALSLASNSDHSKALAVDAHIALTASVRSGDRLTARVSRVTTGATLATYSVEVTRSDGRVCAAFTGTVYIATA